MCGSRLCHTLLHQPWHHLRRRQPKQSLVLHQDCRLLKASAWIAPPLCYRSVASGCLFSALDMASKLSAQSVRLTNAELFIDCTRVSMLDLKGQIYTQPEQL